MARVEMSLRNILLIVAIIILLASASAYTVFTLVGAPLGSRVQGPEAAPSGRAAPGPIFSVGQMIINLSNPGSSSGRVVRAGIAFELDSEKTRRQMEQREEQVKDRIISIVRQQTLESVATNDGLDQLRADLKEEVNGLLVDGHVVNVYLFEWVVP